MKTPKQEMAAVASSVMRTLHTRRSSGIDGAIARLETLEKFVSKFTAAATKRTNELLNEYAKTHSERENEAYRNQLIKAVQDVIKEYNNKIMR